jgi:hypothetical protein
MSLSHLSPEQAELAERIYQTLKQAADADLRALGPGAPANRDGIGTVALVRWKRDPAAAPSP